MLDHVLATLADQSASGSIGGHRTPPGTSSCSPGTSGTGTSISLLRSARLSLSRFKILRFAEKAPTSGLAACLHLSRTAASPQVAVHLGRLLGTLDRGEPLRARQVAQDQGFVYMVLYTECPKVKNEKMPRSSATGCCTSRTTRGTYTSSDEKVCKPR